MCPAMGQHTCVIAVWNGWQVSSRIPYFPGRLCTMICLWWAGKNLRIGYAELVIIFTWKNTCSEMCPVSGWFVVFWRLAWITISWNRQWWGWSTLNCLSSQRSFRTISLCLEVGYWRATLWVYRGYQCEAGHVSKCCLLGSVIRNTSLWWTSDIQAWKNPLKLCLER